MDNSNKNIFLVGGGEISKKETIEIDKIFLEEVGGAEKARLLFFPTAAGDSEGYIEGFSNYFSELGCKEIKSAELTSETTKAVKEKIDWANIIYLGGGDTDFLINVFKAKNVVNFLSSYLDCDNILVGLSAGASALGEVALLSEIKEEVELGNGLRVLPEIICLPHYEDQYRQKLDAVKAKYPNKKVYGIAESSAVHIKDSEIKFINRVVEK